PRFRVVLVLFRGGFGERSDLVIVLLAQPILRLEDHEVSIGWPIGALPAQVFANRLPIWRRLVSPATQTRLRSQGGPRGPDAKPGGNGVECFKRCVIARHAHVMTRLGEWAAEGEEIHASSQQYSEQHEESQSEQQRLRTKLW